MAKSRQAIGALVIGLLAGCGGLTVRHTKFPVGPVASVRILPSQATLAVGQTQVFRVEARDSKGLLVEGASFTWKSLSEGVASVSDGVATGVSPGQTTLLAICHPEPGVEGPIAQARVTVVAGEVPYTFEQRIRPIAERACVCHTTMATTGSMADYNNITAKGYVVAGHPESSPYLTVGAGGMDHPGGNAWGGAQADVRKWIEQGAQP